MLDKLEQLNTEELYKLRMKIIQEDTNLLEYEKRWLKIQYDRMSDNLKSVPCVDMPKEQPKWTPQVQIPKIDPKESGRIATKLVPKAEAYKPIFVPDHIVQLQQKWEPILAKTYKTKKVSQYADGNRDILVALDEAHMTLLPSEIRDRMIYLPGFDSLTPNKRYQYISSALHTMAAKGLVDKIETIDGVKYQIAAGYRSKLKQEVPVA